MARHTRLGLALASAFSLLGIGAGAAPASAATTLIECSAICGDWQIKDSQAGPQGAICAYEKVSRELNVITVRPPKMWDGDLTNKVEWRFVVRHAVGTNPYASVYYSPKQTASVGSGEYASNGHGFSPMKWSAPEVPSGRYLIWIEMQWTVLGLPSGMARAEIDWYKTAWNGTTGLRHNRCPWRIPA